MPNASGTLLNYLHALPVKHVTFEPKKLQEGISVCQQCTKIERMASRRISTRYFVSQFPGQCGIYITVQLLYSKEGPVMHKFQSETIEAARTPAALQFQKAQPPLLQNVPTASEDHDAKVLVGARWRLFCLGPHKIFRRAYTIVQ